MTESLDRSCQTCGSPNPIDAHHCGTCGAELTADAVDESAMGPLPANMTAEMMLDSAVPPRSWAAWGGFLLAVLLLAPWVALAFRGLMGNRGLVVGGLIGFAGGLLASILGIVGIFRTRKRRRRGRGVAITAIPLGLAGGCLQFLLGFLIFGVQAMTAQGKVAVKVLTSPTSELTTRAEEWRNDLGTEKFQDDVTAEQLAGWLESVIETHGQLQSTKVNARDAFGSERGVTLYKVTGQFVNDSAPIELVMRFEKGLDPRLDDIRVDGSSPRDWKPDGS